MSDITCSIDNCERPILARGLCGRHYSQDQRGKFRGTCSVPECSSPIRHREWCNKHYQRWNLHGDPLADNRPRAGTCSVTDCMRKALAKGLCNAHYKRAEAGVPVDATPLRRYIRTDDLRERLRQYALPGLADECWPWTGSLNKGYGVIAVAGSKVRIAHDVAWESHHGRALPKGMVVRHSCDNPPCVNPAHLLLGTHGDNSQDKVDRNRQAKGSGHGIAKLTEVDIPVIRALHNSGASQKFIAAQFGVTQGTVSHVIRGATWAHVLD